MGCVGRLSVADGTPAPDRKQQHRVDRHERALRSFAPAIAMMKATEPGTGDHRRRPRSLAFHWPSFRRILIQGIVNPVVVIVADVIANEPPEMLFVECDDMIENLAAAASHPAFRHPIGKGCQLQVIVTLTIDLSRSPTLFIRCEVRSSNW
jgi:hypothetical protein